MKAKDYRTALEPVWCTGCGDFGVLKGLTQALSDLEIPVEKLAMISGIGCWSRLPGYVRSYAFNSVHGRALPIATGIKLARPELTTVVVGGDGDGFSIGLGHIPHCVRRDVNLTYAVLDNGIYGLTKGQASPTTDPDLKRELGLAGAAERPINPVLMLLGSGCGFVARTHAGNLPHLRSMFREAIMHPGFAFVHVLAACVTYQPASYADVLWKRCSMVPDEHDPSSFERAVELARAERFMLGVLYRRPPDQAPVTAGPEAAHSVGVWPPAGATSQSAFPG